MKAKSVIWESVSGKYSVRIVERLEGDEGIEFWGADQHSSVIIRIEEAKAIANALTYFKNEGVIK